MIMNKTTIEAIESLPVPWHLQCGADGCERLAVFRHESGISQGCALHVADYPDEKWIPIDEISSTAAMLRLATALREREVEMQAFCDVVREYIAAKDSLVGWAALLARHDTTDADIVNFCNEREGRLRTAEAALRKIVEGDR